MAIAEELAALRERTLAEIAAADTSAALEAVRALTGWGQPLTGKLAIIDMLDRRWREVAVPKDAECPICRG